MAYVIKFGYASDVGRFRENNEDAALVFYADALNDNQRPAFGVFAVADGMGGHLSGEKASAIATETLLKDTIRRIYQPIFTGTDPTGQLPVGDIILDAVANANQEIRQKLNKAGTTLTALVVFGNMAHIVHVGDSRAYMIRDDEIERITEDHTVVERLVQEGHMSREEAALSPDGHRIYRALGMFEVAEADTYARRFRAGNRILLCSDGLYNEVPDDTIVSVIGNAPSPQDACDELIRLANAHGSPDNITVILVEMVEA
jgi:protein phosphatase